MGTLAMKSDPRLGESAFLPKSTPKYEAYLEYMEALELHMKYRDYEAAIEHANKALAIDPSFVTPMMVAAIAYSNLRKYEGSDKMLQKTAGN